MNFDQLLYIDVLAHSASMGQAADTLHITKTGLSSAINQVEQELSLKLFERSVKGTVLTENGRKLLPQIQLILHEQNNLKILSQQLFDSDNHAKIIIHYVNSIAEMAIREYTLLFRKEHPDIQVEVTKNHANQIIHEVINNKIDAGIIAINNLEDHHRLKELNVIPICQSSLKLIVGPNHRLYTATTITKQDLQKATFIVYDDFFNEQSFSRLQTICGPLNIGVKVDNGTQMFKGVQELNMLGLGRITSNIKDNFHGCRLFDLNQFIPDTFTLAIITKHPFNDYRADFSMGLQSFINDRLSLNND